MTSHDYTLLSLILTMIGVLVTTTWRFSAMMATLRAATEQRQREYEESKKKTEQIDRVPLLEQRVGMLEKNHSIIPKLEARVIVVEEASKVSKEHRLGVIRPPSRPGTE